MPTIDQLPGAQPLSAADELVVSQVVGGSRTTGKLTLSALFTRNLAVVAAGTTAPTATLLTARLNVVSSGTGGVALNEAATGPDGDLIVVNSTSATVYVYPAGVAGSGTINGGAAGAAALIAAGGAATFSDLGSSNWITR